MGSQRVLPSRLYPLDPLGPTQLHLRGMEGRSLSHCEDNVLFPLPTRALGSLLST